jgi:EAL domain-containing protein (putative c-di-GMP-specific phosphodiesterase class I)
MDLVAGLLVLAPGAHHEGIESEADAQFLGRLGCEFGQGYFFSPALDGQGVLDYIARHYDITATTEPG